MPTMGMNMARGPIPSSLKVMVPRLIEGGSETDLDVIAPPTESALNPWNTTQAS